MADESPDWQSFWDLASPEEAARILLESYGADAIGAATECAETAEGDGRETDHQFWIAVLAHLRGTFM
jgi:hypothetical protein